MFLGTQCILVKVLHKDLCIMFVNFRTLPFLMRILAIVLSFRRCTVNGTFTYINISFVVMFLQQEIHVFSTFKRQNSVAKISSCSGPRGDGGPYHDTTGTMVNPALLPVT